MFDEAQGKASPGLGDVPAAGRWVGAGVGGSERGQASLRDEYLDRSTCQAVVRSRPELEPATLDSPMPYLDEMTKLLSSELGGSSRRPTRLAYQTPLGAYL